VLGILAMVVALLGVWATCALFIIVHAFQRSIGTGFMVLCIPCYIFYYAFSQFEHPRKNLIVSGMCASAGLCLAMSVALQSSLTTSGPALPG
jgi:benzodiazapine receptor